MDSMRAAILEAWIDKVFVDIRTTLSIIELRDQDEATAWLESLEMQAKKMRSPLQAED